jgi:hypothetical protein
MARAFRRQRKRKLNFSVAGPFKVPARAIEKKEQKEKGKGNGHGS